MPAMLGELRGRGYLAVETAGYRRAEGVFFTQVSDRRKCLDYIVKGVPAQFRGTLLREDGSEQDFFGDVYVQAVREEGGRLRVEVHARHPV